MDFRWKPLKRDSKREVRVILHPTAAIHEVRRGMDSGSDDSIDLSPYVKDASHTAFEAHVTFSFNRELYGAGQPKPNQIIEIQLKRGIEWKPVWLGHVDNLNSYTMSRGERSVQLIAKTRDQQDIWRNTPRVTPLFPQMTNLTYMAQYIARSAGMKGDEIVLPPSSLSTAHSNTQLADMTAWDMVSAIFLALGWTPFIDSMGRLRAADRGVQSRQPDVKLTDDRIIRVGGSRSRPPVNRVRVVWLSPELRMWKQQGRLLWTETMTMGWWLPYWNKTIKFSPDETVRAVDVKMHKNPGLNNWIQFCSESFEQQTPTRGKLKIINGNAALIGGLMTGLTLWVAKRSDEVAGVIPIAGTLMAPLGGGPVTGTIPVLPTMLHTVPSLKGSITEATLQGLLFAAMLNVGTASYEFYGKPYDWVHARNTSEAFDSSVPIWVNNVSDIECDFVTNEEHARSMAIRELIYQARSASKWSVTIVDDPRIEYGDILEFPDGSKLYVEDFSRSLGRGSEATLDVSGFLIPVGTIVGERPLAPDLSSPEAGLPGFPGVPELPPVTGGGEGGGGGDRSPTIPGYYDIVVSTLAKYNPVIPSSQQEEGKAQLCRAAAWEVYKLNPQIGMLEKTGGAQAYNMSTDLFIQKSNGDYADMCTAKENGNGTVTIQATWGPGVGDSNTTDASRWVQPTQALADLPGPMAKV